MMYLTYSMPKSTVLHLLGSVADPRYNVIGEHTRLIDTKWDNSSWDFDTVTCMK